jgi:hypothetical protein
MKALTKSYKKAGYVYIISIVYIIIIEGTDKVL